MHTDNLHRIPTVHFQITSLNKTFNFWQFWKTNDNLVIEKIWNPIEKYCILWEHNQCAYIQLDHMIIVEYTHTKGTHYSEKLACVKSLVPALPDSLFSKLDDNN